MKLIHTSDLHLGKKVNGFSMIEDQRYILDRILDAVQDEQADALLIAGDVYDRNSPSSEAVALYDSFLSRLSEMNIQVFVISGNHDMAQNIAFGSSIMESEGIHLSPVYDGEIRPVILNDQYGEIRFYLMPFVRPASVRAALPEAEISSYSDALRAAVEAMNIDPEKRNVLVVHQFVVGSLRSDSEDISVGGTDGVDAEIFEELDYVALGHLHRPQKAVRDTVRYSGSPLKYSVSEAGDEKSVTVVEMREKGEVSVRLRELKPLHDLRRIKGKYDELVSRDYYSGTDTDDYMHIVLTEESEIMDVMGRLRAVYPNIMKLEYENLRTSYDQEPFFEGEVKDASPFELFKEFYSAQNNRDMTEEQAEFLEKIINEIWEVQP